MINEWRDQVEGMEEMLKLLNPLRERLALIKSVGQAWSYIGADLYEVFEKTVAECEAAYIAAQDELQHEYMSNNGLEESGELVSTEKVVKQNDELSEVQKSIVSWLSSIEQKRAKNE